MTRIWMTAAILVLGFAWSPAGNAQETPPAAVGTDTVRTEPLRQTIPVLGRLVTRQSGAVAARIAGSVAQMQVDVGDRVGRGDVLAVLRTDRLGALRNLRRAEVAETQAALESAQARLQLARQEMQRLERLRQSAAFSQARLDDQRQQVSSERAATGEAEARLDRAHAQLRLAEIDLADAEIRAPFAGVVTRKHVSAGDYLAAGAPVITLLDDDELEVEADVPADNVDGLAAGRLVALIFPDGERATAAVRAVVPDENPLTRTRVVRFTPELTDIASRHRALAVNQSVTVHIPLGAPREVVSVHKDAVLVRGGRSMVYVVEDGKAVMRPVSLGAGVGSRFEVLDGLQVGEEVVVRGNERLRPGQAVQPTTIAEGNS